MVFYGDKRRLCELEYEIILDVFFFFGVVIFRQIGQPEWLIVPCLVCQAENA